MTSSNSPNSFLRAPISGALSVYPTFGMIEVGAEQAYVSANKPATSEVPPTTPKSLAELELAIAGLVAANRHG